jgi:hypothetical protein
MEFAGQQVQNVVLHNTSPSELLLRGEVDDFAASHYAKAESAGLEELLADEENRSSALSARRRSPLG